MRFELLELLQLRSDRIKRFVEFKSGSKIDCSKVWHEYEPKPKEIHVLSVDGSFYSKQYLGYFFGVFGGYAEDYNPETLEQGESFVGDFYVSVIKKAENFKIILTLLMFLSEIKSAYNLAKQRNPSLIMLDGTLTSKFIIPFPQTSWFSKQDYDFLPKVIEEFYPEVKDNCLNYSSIYSLSDEILEKLSDFEDKRDLLEIILIQLVYYEYFITLYNLFMLESNPVIIGIAKTSTGTDLFNLSVPDIKILLDNCDKLGYSNSIYQNLQILKCQFGHLPELDPTLNNKLYEIHINSFYAKYKDVRAINLIEYYHKERTVNPEDLLDYISGTIADGNPYPFILKRMDKEVRITKEDFGLIENKLDFIFNQTGREFLG